MEAVSRETFAKLSDGSLKRKMISILKNPTEAEDAIQDAYVRMLEFERDEGNIKNHAAFFQRTARNIAIDKLRRQRRTDRIFVNIDGAEDVHAEVQQHRCPRQLADEGLYQRQMLDAVMTAITELPSRCGEAYLMSCVDEEIYTDIAVKVGCSVSMIEKYVARARRHIRATVPAEYRLAS